MGRVSAFYLPRRTDLENKKGRGNLRATHNDFTIFQFDCLLFFRFSFSISLGWRDFFAWGNAMFRAKSSLVNLPGFGIWSFRIFIIGG